MKTYSLRDYEGKFKLIFKFIMNKEVMYKFQNESGLIVIIPRGDLTKFIIKN